jgi:site-specific DNA-methyltransferase (adenine-specific)
MSEPVEAGGDHPYGKRGHDGNKQQNCDCTLYLGDCLEIMPTLGKVDAVVTDSPYEDELHSAIGRIRRNDGREMIKDLGFAGVNDRRSEIAPKITAVSNGWALIFTLAEGVRAWRDDLQSAGAKWDTVLPGIKPDAAPRFNGQGAARGFENCVTAWCGKGYRSWNASGKRGIYTHLVNPPDRTKTKGSDGKTVNAHPTEKPVGLIRELIADYTDPGETVLDAFVGSGTTGVACAKMG